MRQLEFRFLCAICLRGPGEQTDAVTIVSGNAVCREHVASVRADDATVAAIDDAYRRQR